ncbi:protein phosphatase 1 regulatory subunit 17 [Cynoglossus semilaevis]|uniref:protein phosphatase 1 regulatory subunit 17 n=1 Tax=Cynoglossus semilaevis TaxID=244447 RepID=UPI000497A712|nr:protein phosphatase 1 regulatory subunit 17 [Cynoglossus semilaevis]
MTTSCMRSTLEPEHRLMTQDSRHYQGATDDSVSRETATMKGNKDKDEKEALCAGDQEDDQQKKPRRKDTPVLNCPPHLPGVRLLKAEKHVVHLEDAEKDVN